jgi:hypothetical protein
MLSFLVSIASRHLEKNGQHCHLQICNKRPHLQDSGISANFKEPKGEASG